MPFQQITGDTGSYLLSDSTTVTYDTVDVNPGTNATLLGAGFWNSGGARYLIGNPNTPEDGELVLSQAVSGIRIDFYSGFQAGESIFLSADGVLLNLNDLVASGDVTVTGEVVIGAAGDIQATDLVAGGSLTLNVQFQTLLFDHNGVLNGVGFDMSLETTPICFAQGTRIMTANGPVEVEHLRAGDSVITLEGSSEPILWVGQRHHARLGAKHKPIRIAQGALGNGQPERELWVSPQHRMFVSSKIAARVTGAAQLLVPAQCLLALEGVEQVAEVSEITYFHILLTDHRVIWAEGAAAESFFPGPMALQSLTERSLSEVSALLPGVIEGETVPRPAFPFVGGKMGRKLAARLAKQGRPIIEDGAVSDWGTPQAGAAPIRGRSAVEHQMGAF